MSRRPVDPAACRSRVASIKLAPDEYTMLRALAWNAETGPSGVVRDWIAADWNEDVLKAYKDHVRRMPREDRHCYRRTA